MIGVVNFLFVGTREQSIVFLRKLCLIIYSVKVMRKYFCVREKREDKFVNSTGPSRVGFGIILQSRICPEKNFQNSK